MSAKRRLIYELNSARHVLMKSLDARCRQALGISSTQLSALMILHENPRCLMKELAQTLLLDKSAVTGLVSRMESKVLLQKLPCENDSRAVRLAITDTGERLREQGLKLLQAENEVLEAGFDEQELAIISRFLCGVTARYSD